MDCHLSIHQSHRLPERVSPTTLLPTPLPLQCIQASSRVIYYLPLMGLAATCLPTSLGTMHRRQPHFISSSTLECKPDPFHFSYSALTLSTSSGSVRALLQGKLVLRLLISERSGQIREAKVASQYYLLSALPIYMFTYVHMHTHTDTHTHRAWPVCLGVQSYLDTCLLGWQPRGPHGSQLCTGHSGHRSCCEGTSDTCLSGGRSSRGHWGPRCCCTDKADKVSLDHVPQRGPQSSHRHRARSGNLEGTRSQATHVIID